MLAVVLRYLLKPWRFLFQKQVLLELRLRAIVSRTKPGIKGVASMSGELYHFHDASTFVNQFREIFFKEVYRIPFSGTEPVIIEGGGNMGLAICYWKQNYPSARIISFEPDGNIFEILKLNTARYLDSVCLMHGVLAGSKEEVCFFPDGRQGGRKGLVGIPVKSFLLSEVLMDYSLVDLLKLDIEGSEYEVLKEAKGQLHRVKRLFVEYHCFEKEEERLPDLLNLLAEAGFSYQISGENWNKPFVNSFPDIGLKYTLNVYASRF